MKRIDIIQHLVDIFELGLDYLKKESDHIRIGAATPINAIGASPLFLSGPYGALSDAAGAHSTTTIRNRATVGGNLCNASPCADLALPLLVTDGCTVMTIEGLQSGPEVHPLQKAFVSESALQCGYCTPAMIMAANALINTEPEPNEDTIRENLANNLCRCTGYDRPVKAVLKAVKDMKENRNA
jgi:xanthine dehydrogenase iron-sulfur cluster and FAD-binding subunit A